MNSIPQNQNIPSRLNLLAAQRQLYSDAKKIQAIRIIVFVLFAIVWLILIAIFPKYTVYSTLWGLLIAALELLVLSPNQKSIQEKAAKIQQAFDCEVLQLDWAKFHCETPVDPETINEASTRFIKNNKDYSALKNWYPISVAQLPIYQARIICQRVNAWWDAKLRRRYANCIVIVLSILTIIVVMIGLIRNLTIGNLLEAVVSPLIPVFTFGLPQCHENYEAATKLDRLRDDAEILVREVIDGKFTQQYLESKSYELQGQIYDNRRRNPLIFNWIYSRLKHKDEENMNKGAEYWVQQLTKIP